MSREIALGNRGSIIVDDEDYDRVNQFNWTLDRNGYAVRMIQIQPKPNRKRKKILVHRFILNADSDLHVDHINRNKLDNRRSNLRQVTQVQNNANMPSRLGANSPYKGVWFAKKDNTWRAEVRVNGVRFYLGRHKDGAEAARAYDRKAYELWGEYAYLNFPGDMAQQVSAARS